MHHPNYAGTKVAVDRAPEEMVEAESDSEEEQPGPQSDNNEGGVYKLAKWRSNRDIALAMRTGLRRHPRSHNPAEARRPRACREETENRQTTVHTYYSLNAPAHTSQVLPPPDQRGGGGTYEAIHRMNMRLLGHSLMILNFMCLINVL